MQSLRFRGDFPSPTRWPTDPSNLQKAPVWVWQRLWQAAVRSICSSVPCHSGSLQRVANREEMCPNHLPKHSPSLFLQIFAPIQSSAPPAPPPLAQAELQAQGGLHRAVRDPVPPGPWHVPSPLHVWRGPARSGSTWTSKTCRGAFGLGWQRLGRGVTDIRRGTIPHIQ